MSAPICLVIDSMHESLFSMLAEIGWKVDYRPKITRDEIKMLPDDYAGLIVRSKTFIDEDILRGLKSLKLIGRAGAGLDNLDLRYLSEKGIHVLHASEGNRDAVGEYTVGALLSLMRNIPRADAEVKEFTWKREPNRGEELMDKTVGIIGYGNMAQAFAKRLSGFGCNVLAYDKYKKGFTDLFCKESDMETLEAETDILSLHIPLTAETKFLVSKTFLKRFKKRIIVVNTARGEIVSLSDLADAFDEGGVRGAVLDVLENEKLEKLSPVQLRAFNALRKNTNVIFTPHIAGWTFESHVKINVALVTKIQALQLA